MSHDQRHDRIGLVLSLSALVVVWRIAAALSPYREGVLATMNDDPLGVRWSLGMMGVLFMACGVYAYARVRDPAVLLFALSACAGGLHWGGPIGAANPTLGAAILLFYFVASGLLGQALFLHFVLSFTGTVASIKDRKWGVLYLPAAAAAVVSLGIVALPMESDLSKLLRQIFWLLVTAAIVYDLIVLVTLVVRVVRPKQDGPSRNEVGLILAAFGIVALVTLAPGFGVPLPIGTDALNHVHILIPLAIAAVIVKRGHQGAPRIS